MFLLQRRPLPMMALYITLVIIKLIDASLKLLKLHASVNVHLQMRVASLEALLSSMIVVK